MAMIDYGVIAKKNKRHIKTDGLFTAMIDTLGFSIEKDNCGDIVDGNYFLFLGDRDLYIGIYKESITFFNDNYCLGRLRGLPKEPYIKGKKYSHCEVVKGVEFNIKRIDEGNRYYCSFSYKCDFYEFIYGYGVDTDIEYWYDKNNKAMNKVKRFYRNTL